MFWFLVIVASLLSLLAVCWFVWTLICVLAGVPAVERMTRQEDDGDERHENVHINYDGTILRSHMPPPPPPRRKPISDRPGRALMGNPPRKQATSDTPYYHDPLNYNPLGLHLYGSDGHNLPSVSHDHHSSIDHGHSSSSDSSSSYDSGGSSDFGSSGGDY